MDTTASAYDAAWPEGSEVAARLHEVDWPRHAGPGTALLGTALSICLHSPVPMVLLWGPRQRCLYNDACLPLLGGAHPQALDRPLSTLAAPAFESLRAQLAAPNDAAAATFAASGGDAAEVPAWRCSAVPDADGGVIATLCIAVAGRHAAPAPPPALPLAAAENSPAFLAVLRGPDYVVESANQRFQDVVGGRDVLGHPLLEVVPELEAQGFRELLERVGHSAQPFVGESMTAVLSHPSDERPYEARFDFIYQPMRSAHGEVDLILVHGVDVTQQQRWEARDSFLLALEDALQHVTEPQQIVDTSVRLLGEHLQASRCAYGLMDDHGDGIRVVSDHVHDVPSLQGHFLLQGVAEGLMEALRDNRPWLLNDADAPGAPGYLVEHYRRIGMRASLAVPLHKNGRLVAAMGVHQRVPRQWLSTEVELVRLVGARCWESLQRARMQRQLAASEARLRRLADVLPQVVFIAGQDGGLQYFNRRWYEYTGLDPAADAREAWRQAHTAEGLRQADQAWAQALAGERAYEMECELRAHDGRYRWHLARALPVREDDGSIRQWIGTYTDIHDRRGFEQRLRESELRFRTLCETVPAMIWMSDADGDCVYWNPQWYAFTGRSEDQALPHGWWDAVHPDDAVRLRHASERALERRGAFVIDYRLRRADGQYRWCADTASPHFGVDGEFLGHIGTVIDISERKHIEDATASERSILSLITTGAPLPVVLEAIALSVEARGEQTLYCSLMLADARGEGLDFAAAPSLPHDYGLQFGGVPISMEGPPFARSAYSGRQVICEDVARDPGWGAYRSTALGLGLAACCVTPILGGNGRVLGTLSMYYDRPHLPSLREQAMARSASHLAGIVIERNRVDAELKQSLRAETAARSEAEHASRVKDEFLATLSHELRTPLNAILGWSRLMQTEGFDPHNIDKGLVIIERSARAQTQIIDDLLDMSAILSGKVRLQPEPFDLVALVRSTVDLMQPTALARQIELGLEGDDRQPLPFFGDAGRLQQVLTNLIGNALKFTPAAGRISVSVQVEETRLRIAVRDSGIGIAPDFLPHVFDRFRQADAGTNRRVGGLGLGLSISRQLVDLHGGSLGVASDGQDQGTTFTIVLPLRDRGAHGQGDDAPARDAVLPTVSQRLQDVRVMLVDDDQDSREAAEQFLLHAGARVVTAGSADAAETALLTHPFDVLVSDIAMPRRDGYELIRQVRSGHGGLPRHLPAIALTAYVRDEDRDRAMLAGFDAHLGKPLDASSLVELIEALTLSSHRGAV